MEDLTYGAIQKLFHSGRREGGWQKSNKKWHMGEGAAEKKITQTQTFNAFIFSAADFLLLYISLGSDDIM